MAFLQLGTLIAVSTATVIVYFWWKIRQHFGLWAKYNIPGPPPSHLFGNMWEIYKKGHAVAQKEWHEKYGPIVGYFMGSEPFLLVADVELLKTILVRDFHNFSDRSEIFSIGRASDALTELKGQRWKDVRSTLTPSFTTSKLKQIAPAVCLSVDDFINNIDAAYEKDGKANILQLYQGLTLDTICRNAMGADFEIQKDVANNVMLKQLKSIFEADINIFLVFVISLPVFVRMLLGRIIQSIRLRSQNNGDDPFLVIRGKCDQVVKQRRASPKGQQMDLLQLMIDARISESSNLDSLTAGDKAEKTHQQNDGAKDADSLKAKYGGLTESEIVDNAFLVLLAGYETTSTALIFITCLLLRFPDDQEKIREELIEATNNGTVFDFEKLQRCQYLEAFIQEALRLYPPAHSFSTRVPNEERTINGCKIPVNTSVMVSMKELHSNEEVFPEPTEFRPSRFLPENKTAAMNFAHQPFGMGPRNCIGMRFAQMEIKLTLAKLLTKYRLESKDEPKGKSEIKVKNLMVGQHPQHEIICNLKRL